MFGVLAPVEIAYTISSKIHGTVFTRLQLTPKDKTKAMLKRHYIKIPIFISTPQILGGGQENATLGKIRMDRTNSLD